MSETFGERLRRLRERTGYTVAGLARAVDVSEGAVRQLEAGSTRNPSFETGLRIAHALGVDPYVLLFGCSRPPEH